MRKLILALPLAAALVFFACTKQKTETETSPAQKSASAAPVEVPSANHWKYFSVADNGSVELKNTDAVSEIPAAVFKPWTEAVQVADFGLNNGNAVFLINKCGLYPIRSLQSSAKLPVGHELFSQATAGDLYTVDGQFFIRIYQNSIFLSRDTSENTLFLLRADSGFSSYTPVADVTYLHLPKGAQCKSLEQVGGQWYASFKADNGTDISFSYVKCSNFASFMQKDAYKHIEQLSAEEFRAACEPPLYNRMPDMLKELADTIESNRDLYLKVFTEDSADGSVFFKPARNQTTDTMEERVPVTVYAVQYSLSDASRSAALLLPDGTLMLNASRRGIRKVQLPSLPENFSYTAFSISDTAITAAWEESIFYEIGRAGIFTAKLSELGL
ncbi:MULTISPECIES: hypothetical protein [unclassified Treponema]|uniref:hypothetical protein n=1 Tax=unclassified Treponema TaxID=2638727 RepID=UPI000B06D93C|nr:MULTISPECIES: hypothetical protein [unclassified Treponema]